MMLSEIRMHVLTDESTIALGMPHAFDRELKYCEQYAITYDTFV